MAEASLNFQTQSTGQVDASYFEGDGQVSDVKKGQFEAQNVIASTNVDPTTKDDEVASTFQAEKNQKKELRNKGKEQDRLNKLRAVQASQEPRKIDEQDRRGKRITKQTEARLRSIYQETSRDLSATIQNRSNALFSGSEDKYLEFAKRFDQLNIVGVSKFKADLSEAFDDVAERHNALQIIVEVGERKLAKLKDLAQKTSERSRSEEREDAHSDYQHLQDQVNDLEQKLEQIQELQTQLMAANGDRIEDSYKLAPLLREVTAQLTHDVTLPPKAFNALVLDEILPLKGDLVQTFNKLTGHLIEDLASKSSTPYGAVACFYDNLSIVEKCLTSELKCCPDRTIASAILNGCRSIEKLGTVQRINENIVGNLSGIATLT